MATNPQLRVDLPPRIAPVLLAPSRFKVLYGGRDSAKSWSIARLLVAMTYSRKLRVMCGREIQKSIKDSVHKLLADQIEVLGLSPWFNVQQSEISSSIGSEFIFVGLQEITVKNVKSIEGIDLLWVEEAENTSARSWEVIIPTIRKPGSEIWVSFNPDLETDPTFKMFVTESMPGANVVGPLTWKDNPWPSEVLAAQREYLYRVDPEAAAHVWGGKCRTNSDAQVLRGKCVVESFEPQAHWDGPYFGADWGFSQDPTTLIRFWVDINALTKSARLYIEHEAYGVGVDLDKLPAMFDEVPGARVSRIRADNARPETISYLQRHGYGGVFAAEKWPGSVEDGVAFLRQFSQIVIHPRCEKTFEESRLWSHKKDRLTGDVLTDLVDANNHCWDAIRYGLEPMIKRGGMAILDYMRERAGGIVTPVAQTITHTLTSPGLQFPPRP